VERVTAFVTDLLNDRNDHVAAGDRL